VRNPTAWPCRRPGSRLTGFADRVACGTSSICWSRPPSADPLAWSS